MFQGKITKIIIIKNCLVKEGDYNKKLIKYHNLIVFSMWNDIEEKRRAEVFRN